VGSEGVLAARLVEKLENWAPLHWAEDWDNVGLLLGDEAGRVRKVLVALDATQAVVNEAVAGGYDFLICHHPPIHDPLKKITAANPLGRKIMALLHAGIGLYCMHTNLDKASGGVNDCLFERLGLQEASPLIDSHNNCPGLGLVGVLPEAMTLTDFALHAKKALALSHIRYVGDGDKKIQKLGICGGDASHSRYWMAAREKNCDAFVTGDLRYHGSLDAFETGMALVDITHYAGEIWIVDAIAGRLRHEAAQDGLDIIIEASKIDGQIFCHS